MTIRSSTVIDVIPGEAQNSVLRLTGRHSKSSDTGDDIPVVLSESVAEAIAEEYAHAETLKRQRRKGNKSQVAKSRKVTKRETEAVMRRFAVTDPTLKSRAARKAVRDSIREQQAALAEAEALEQEITDDLPEPVKRRHKWGRFTFGKGTLWGPISPGVPWHITSSARIGMALPFLAARPDAIPGPIIGLETSTKQFFTYDVWNSLGKEAKKPTSPGVVVFGLMNTGKSFVVKLIMIRLMVNGRYVIVSSDPKGEWAPIAHAVGGQIVSIGPGSGNCINPLDEGTKPMHISDEEWLRLVMSRRSLALNSICKTLRPHKLLDEFEKATLNLANQAVANGEVEPTIRAIVDYLRNPPKEILPQVGTDAPKALATILGLLCSGHLAGMFDGYSTVRLDPTAPMVSIDTSHLVGAEPEVRAIAHAASSAWIDATLRSQDGRYRCVVSEEGWDELRNPYQAQAMDERLRMSGHWRVSNWLIFHELADIQQFGAEGSEHRNKVKGIITKSQTKILFRQSHEAMKVIHEYVRPTNYEAKQLTNLRQGQAFWHIGDQTPLSIFAIAGRSIYNLINTDAGRDGK